MSRMHNPPHPGSVLVEWLGGMKGPDSLTVTQLAKHIHVTRATVSRIIHGHASITPEIAIRLEQALGTSRDMWLGMQSQYDLWVAEQQPRPRIKRIQWKDEHAAENHA